MTLQRRLSGMERDLAAIQAKVGVNPLTSLDNNLMDNLTFKGYNLMDDLTFKG